MIFDAPKLFFSTGSDIAKISGFNAVSEAIKNILSVEPGESHITQIGCNLKQFQFSPINTFYARLIMMEIERAIIFHCDNLDQVGVKVKPDPDDESFKIDVFVKVKSFDEIIKRSTSLRVVA